MTFIADSAQGMIKAAANRAAQSGARQDDLGDSQDLLDPLSPEDAAEEILLRRFSSFEGLRQNERPVVISNPCYLAFATPGFTDREWKFFRLERDI